MTWIVNSADEFDAWFVTLNETQQDDLLASIELLKKEGPRLGRPYADTLEGSRHTNMKELITQSQGNPIRTFFAFDPKREALLLVGGDKTGDKRFYKRMIPIADDILDKHLADLKKKGK